MKSIDLWTDYLVGKFAPVFAGKKLPRVAIDFANGSGADVAIDVLTRLGFELDVYNNAPDGNNINLNCGALYPEGLARVLATKVATQDFFRKHHSPPSVGFAFDGDADRCVVLDNAGAVIPGDVLLAFLAIHMGATDVVSTVMLNGGAEKYLESRGINVHRTAVGDRHVIAGVERCLRRKSCEATSEASTRESRVVVAGEPSGHYVFPDIIMCDDGLVSALMVLKMFIENNGAFPPMPPLWHSVMKNVTGDVPNMRILIRKSGTENLTRIYVEGENKDKVEQIVDILHN